MVGYFCFPKAIFNQEVFFYYYLVPKLIKSLNSCVMMKNSILKTYEQSQKVSKFVPLWHLYEIKNDTSYFMTSAHLNVM